MYDDKALYGGCVIRYINYALLCLVLVDIITVELVRLSQIGQIVWFIC